LGSSVGFGARSEDSGRVVRDGVWLTAGAMAISMGVFAGGFARRADAQPLAFGGDLGE